MRLPMVLIRATFTCSLILCGSGSLAWAQLPHSVLTSVFPPGGKAGTSFDVTATGQDIDDADQLYFSHPGIKATLKMSPPDEFTKKPKRMEGQFTVTIDGNVPPGLYETRLAGRFGTSNPRVFVVGQLEEIVDNGGNNAPEKALEVKLGSVVSARADGNQYKYYKLALKGNERVVLDCQAERIDSRMDATLAILDPTGKELDQARDNDGSDAYLEFVAPRDGEYLVRCYDAVYAGGPDYFYRLMIHARPHIAFVFPPSGQAGANGSFTVYGQNLPGGQPVAGLTAGGMPLQKITTNISLPGDPNAAVIFDPRPVLQRAPLHGVEYRVDGPGGKSNMVPVYLAKAPLVLEKSDANDADNQAQAVTIPCEVAGQFFPENDLDWYQFEAKKGDQFNIDVISHRMGLPTDPYIAIFRVVKDDQGEKLVDVGQADDPQERNNKLGDDFDTSTDDPTYAFNAPEDGTYKVLVRDNFGSGRNDPSMTYRLVMRPPQPEFTLIAQPLVMTPGNKNQNQSLVAAPVVRKGGTMVVEVEVLREDGFDGEVEIRAEGMPGGMTCSPVLAGAITRTVPLVFVAADNMGAWSGPIKIIGKAKVDNRDIQHEARYAVMVWGTNNRQQQAPSFRFSTAMQVSVLDKEAALVVVQADEKVFETSLGGTLEVPVNIRRFGDFKDNLKLTADGLPNEIKPKEINADGNTGATKLEIQLTQQNIKPGTYTFYLRGDVKQKYVRNPDAVPALEQEQKELTDAINQLNEAQKQANTAKDEATKKAGEAANAVKQAEQEKNAAAEDAKAAAEKKLQDAQAAAKTAEEAKVAAEQAAKEAADKVANATKMKQQLDNTVNQAKQANQPKDVTFAVGSTPIRMRIVSTPISVAANSGVTVKQGEKAEANFKLTKNFGFDEQVELSFEPKGIQNLNAPKGQIQKGQTDGKFEISAGKDTPPGEYEVPVKAKGRFNNVNIEADTTVKVKVEPAPEPAK